MRDICVQMIRQNRGLDVEGAVSWLESYKEVSGESTEYWYRYVCKILDRAGLLTVGFSNPAPMIFVHLATLAIITQEFQTIMLDEEALFEHEYASYLDDLSIAELEDLYCCYVNGDDILDDGESWRDDCNDEYDLREKLSERLVENNRQKIVDCIGVGQQGHADLFEAIVLTVRFPSADYEKYADQIEDEFPVDVDDLRSRSDFESYSEYVRYLKSDDSSEFVYGNGVGLSDPDLQRAFEWWQGGCQK